MKKKYIYITPTIETITLFCSETILASSGKRKIVIEEEEIDEDWEGDAKENEIDDFEWK